MCKVKSCKRKENWKEGYCKIHWDLRDKQNIRNTDNKFKERRQEQNE